MCSSIVDTRREREREGGGRGPIFLGHTRRVGEIIISTNYYETGSAGTMAFIRCSNMKGVWWALFATHCACGGAVQCIVALVGET
jgi:hypothetical protein